MLYLVSTPIGNLGDITLRALETLKSVDLIAAEDTRHSGILLKHFEIKKPYLSFHEHNEAQRTQEIVARLKAGENIALISDAGMPSISDPGERLIRACIKENLPYTIIPGPSAVLTSLIGSGFQTENGFYFGGFLPVKSGQRANVLRSALERKEVSIFFESPYRLTKSLNVLHELSPLTKICVARELTKKFEEYRQGTAEELLTHYNAHPPKGEICIVIQPLPER